MVKKQTSQRSQASDRLTNDDVEAIRKIAYDTGSAYLSSQRLALASIRQQAVGFLALNLGVATFLGKGVQDTGLGLYNSLALLSMIACMIVLFLILKPSEGWIFDNEPKIILENYAKTFTLSKAYHHLALYASENAEKNEKKLRLLMVLFNTGALLVVIQILFWVLHGLSLNNTSDSRSVISMVAEDHTSFSNIGEEEGVAQVANEEETERNSMEEQQRKVDSEISEKAVKSPFPEGLGTANRNKSDEGGRHFQPSESRKRNETKAMNALEE